MRPPVRRGGVVAVTSLLVFAVLATACGGSGDDHPTIRLLTHDDFDLPADAIAQYTERTGVDVVVFRESDPTAMADLLARSRATPVADVVIGIDTLELNRVIEGRLVVPYRPIARDPLDAALLVEDDWMIPVSYLDACVNRSISYYTPPPRDFDQLPDPEDVPPAPPGGIGDFTDPAHAPTVVLPDARTSRMGLYFLVALARRYPENAADEDAIAWPQYLDRMLRSGVLVTPSWEEAYFGHFLPGADTSAEIPEDDETGPTIPAVRRNVLQGQTGDETSSLEPLESTDRPVTWGSAGMPAVTVRFQADLPESVDIEVLGQDCIRVVNYAGIVAGTPDRLNAGRLVDAMVEPLFQFGIPDRFGSRPARTDIVRTDAWKEFGVVVDAPLLDPAVVGRLWPQWKLTWAQVLGDFEAGTEVIEPEVTVTLPDRDRS